MKRIMPASIFCQWTAWFLMGKCLLGIPYPRVMGGRICAGDTNDVRDDGAAVEPGVAGTARAVHLRTSGN